MTFRTIPPLAVLALAACGTTAALAAPAVTIYSGDLALIREDRAFDLAGSRDTLRLTGLPAGVDVTSIRFTPAGGARVTGLAWNADVAGGERALELAVGRRVRIGQEKERWLEGTLVAASGGWLLLRAGDGRLHSIARDAAHEVVYEDPLALPGAEPVLEVALDGARAGAGRAELSYLTGGLGWSAEHRLIRGAPGRGEWSASVSVANGTHVTFADASLRLVAGNPARAGGAPPPRPLMKMAMETATAAPQADFVEEAFSEYHLYTLPRPATLAGRQTRQLTMVEPKDVKLTPRYVTRNGGLVTAQLELVNSKAAGPGVPLPAGRVRIFETDASGALLFTGESHIGHTPVDEELTLDVGQAFDLVSERRELAQRRISDREREHDVEVKLRNRKDESVTIRVEENVHGDHEILKRSHPFEVKDANTIRFEVQVPAGKEVTVTYTARVRY